MPARTQFRDAANSRYHVPNLERALEILEHLARQSRGCGISEIAEQLKLPKNSVFRIVSTLHAHGYLRREEDTRQFSLGSKLLSLAYAAVHEGHLVEKSMDIMRQVRDETDETVLVGILDGDEGVVLEQVLSKQQVKVMVGVGTRFPLHTAAPAKAMMAHLPPEELGAALDRIRFDRFTDATITTRQAMLADVEAAAKRGWAVDNAEHNVGIRCVAAAVLDQRAYPVGAIWITGPAYRIAPEQFPRLGQIVAAGALRISRRFGHDAQM